MSDIPSIQSGFVSSQLRRQLGLNDQPNVRKLASFVLPVVNVPDWFYFAAFSTVGGITADAEHLVFDCPMDRICILDHIGIQETSGTSKFDYVIMKSGSYGNHVRLRSFDALTWAHPASAMGAYIYLDQTDDASTWFSDRTVTVLPGWRIHIWADWTSGTGEFECSFVGRYRVIKEGW